MRRFIIGSITLTAVAFSGPLGCGERSPCEHLCHVAHEKAMTTAMLDSTGKKKRLAGEKFDACLSRCE